MNFVCERCLCELEDGEAFPASCCIYINCMMIDNALIYGIGDPILCNECLHLYIAIFAPDSQYLMDYLKD